MGLSETRKILSIILSVIIAISSAAIIVSILINSIVTSEEFLEKVIITDDMVSQCDAQLTEKYKALATETGIPERVFNQVKEDYGVKDSLVRALQNVFNEEDAALYNKSVVDYFEKLCTEFLKDSEMDYQQPDVRRTAEKATMIYCDTVGFHNVATSQKRINLMKDICSKVGFIAVFILVIGLILLAVIYADRQKGFLYALMGVSAGAFGTFITAVFCFIGRVWNNIQLTPTVFQNAVSDIMKLYFTALVGVSLGVAVVSYVLLLLIYRKMKKKDQRAIVV